MDLPHIVAHRLDLFELLVQLVRLLPDFEDFVGGESSDFFQLRLAYDHELCQRHAIEGARDLAVRVLEPARALALPPLRVCKL